MASTVRMSDGTAVAPAPLLWREQGWAERLEGSIERGANHLLSLQTEEGYWLGELEADTTLESDYIYYLFVLGKADPERIAKLANYVRRRQLRRWRLEYLSRWPVGAERHQQSLFRAETGRRLRRCAAHGPGARHGAPPGRPGTTQILTFDFTSRWSARSAGNSFPRFRRS